MIIWMKPLRKTGSYCHFVNRLNHDVIKEAISVGID
jgi:hypothetical protein